MRPGVAISTFASWQEVADWERKIRANCWECSVDLKKIVTGQPVAGFVAPELVLGTVISTGTCSCFTVGTGKGLKRVVNVLVLSGAVVAEAAAANA